MAELGILLGALMSGLAHARRIADEESAAIAEYYKDNPLLEGMSVPRVRVPELTLELPLLIQSHEEGEADLVADSRAITTAVSKELRAGMKETGVSLPAAELNRFDASLNKDLSSLSSGAEGRRMPKEAVAKSADAVFSRMLRNKIQEKFGTEVASRLASVVRKQAGQSAIAKTGQAPRIDASIITAEVKEHADHANVSRLRITLKEEGLEWSVGENADGTQTRKLTPE